MWIFNFFNDESWCLDNFREFQGKSKIDFLIKMFMRFSLKGNLIQIHMLFPFLTVLSLLFQNISYPDITSKITYLLLLLENNILIPKETCK